MRRREFIGLAGAAAIGWALAVSNAAAQPSDRVRRIAMLSGFAATDPEAQARVSSLQQGLKELGWAEGRNLRIEFRWGTGQADEMRELAKELLELKPDLILAMTTPAVSALVEETKTIPIVFVNIVDPLGRGFIANMGRPGGNVTGFVNFEFSMAGKWLETLKQIAPATRRAAFLFNPQTAPFAKSFVGVAEAAASSVAMEPIAAGVHDQAELERVMADFASKPAGGLIVLPDAFTVRHRDVIIALAAHYRLPAIYPLRAFATSGGLVSDGGDPTDLFRRAASYVDRILKGANPGDLPVQAATKFELVINLKTAKALDLEVPPTLLARADEVIE